MQIIKDNQLCDNAWQFIADDADLPAGDISVSFNKWQQAETQLLNHEGKLGVRIGSADAIASIASDLDKIALVELDFPDFADGRRGDQLLPAFARGRPGWCASQSDWHPGRCRDQY